MTVPNTVTILITGFGRFPGSPINPSGLLAAQLVRLRRPALADTRRVSHVFATRYDAVDRELHILLACERPDILVMFGLATRARHMRVESRARNRVSMLHPDAGGFRPAGPTIAPGAEALRNPIPLTRLVRAARATGLPVMRSRNAGTYLCNYVYWRALEAAARPGGPRLVIFIHVPPIAFKAMPKRRHHLPLRVDDLTRAGDAILRTAIVLAPRRAILSSAISSC